MNPAKTNDIDDTLRLNFLEALNPYDLWVLTVRSDGRVILRSTTSAHGGKATLTVRESIDALIMNAQRRMAAEKTE